MLGFWGSDLYRAVGFDFVLGAVGVQGLLKQARG